MAYNVPRILESSPPVTSEDDDRIVLSSPPRLPKERRNPSITPRKFKRFFTPRSRVPSVPSAARRALRDLAGPVLNRCQTPSSPLKPILEGGILRDNSQPADQHRAPKRRKVLHRTPETSPVQRPSCPTSSPALARLPDDGSGLLSPSQTIQASQTSLPLFESDSGESEADLPHGSPTSPSCLLARTPLARHGLGARLAERMITGNHRWGRERLYSPVPDWRMETADFCSTPRDVHMCSSHEGAPRCIPFCTASCHSNSLVAVGDEEGHVRLLDSDKSFDNIHLSFQAHSNAIIDLDFSEDDYLLATASGDQTGKVMDMMTQTPVSILGHHTASLKQVRFQPGRGSSSVLATSSRDGSVQIWDLRCRGGPVQQIPTDRDTSLHYRLPRPVNPGCVVNSIYDAHARTLRQTRQQMRHLAAPSTDVASRGEVPGRVGEVSVTAIQFLQPGREHLLLSACEADACVKLWDIRSIHTSRHHKSSTPISYTQPPESHTAWRPFGISSMALSTDGARLYALCKDNTVYAYSTAHLVLGHAPELSARAATEPPRRKAQGTAQEGLGPLYGFRHSSFHATSFYIKAAIRPARDGRSELLAVGSSDGCAVLFPTDERYFRRDLGGSIAGANGGDEMPASTLGSSFPAGVHPLSGGSRACHQFNQGPRPRLVRTNSVPNLSGRLVDKVPILRSGTPLVRGHDKEVGPVAWTNEGKLVTVGDDYLVRCWSESRDRATGLRRGGESEGRRWACGWADVGDEWGGDDDEW
ncbi:hypothetical protein VTK73DRAFT_8116 [Phialemonium thermophilum]|uniref:Uncharacterized protein n=1 Tax=Phialemonium thermophilum TaxID=223376 RepID=A0ABR3XQ03_9PEZI